MKSVFDNILSKVALRPIAASSEQVGVAIDTLGYSSLMVTVENGAATGTPDSYVVDGKITECATSGGSYTDITGAVITQMTANNKSAQIRVDGLNDGTRLRYIKVVVTPAMTGGTSPKALVSANCMLGRGQKLPVGNSATPA